jgi:uncharacterized protein YsxB (DUF464 family)
MIDVNIRIQPYECYARSEGHAESRRCAAVSGLMYTLIGACTNLLGDVKHREDKGNIEVSYVTASAKNKRLAETIFTVVAIGLVQIANTYPDDVRVVVEE